MKCCNALEYHSQNHCDIHLDDFECPDCIIHYTEKFDEYGIIIHDGGQSVITIQFCPFCGAKLPDSKRELWFSELEKIGITDSDDPRIPSRYFTKEWFN